MLSEAMNLKPWLSELRRHLHQQPELSLEERDTSQFCQDKFKSMGYEITPCFGHGFIADLQVPGANKCIAIRADMDALPIQELNDVPYCSRVPNVAHMCGHDSHMAVAMGAARLLKTQHDQLRANVRFVFQPSEEVLPGGALGMIANGALEGVDAIYGLHNDPGTEVGHIRTCPGPLTAIADVFNLSIRGRGCHGAKPHEGLDATVAASMLITQWQSIVARSIDPQHAAVLTVGKLHSGEAPNVISGHAEMTGTIRTFSEVDRKIIHDNLRHSLSPYRDQGFVMAMDIQKGYPSIVNPAEQVNYLADVVAETSPDLTVDTETLPASWAEDFAYYLEKVPGVFFFLGSGNSARGIDAPLHSSNFDIDENCLPIGSAILAGCVTQQPA